MLRCLRLSLATLAVCLAVPLTSFAQAAVPSANTYVLVNSSTNYGGSNGLSVSPTNLTFIQFDFSWLPQSASVNKATLRLFLDNITANGSFDVYQVNGAWTQTTLNYYNLPPIGISATGGNPRALITSQIRNFVLLDITALVQAWVSGSTPNYGVALQLTTPAGNLSFDSKENTNASHQPEIEIVLNGPAGPQGPQGSQGPNGLSGSQGPAGPQGPAGATGPAGPQGPQGLSGATGQQGPAGVTGPAGPIGQQGPQGQAGPSGTNGVSFNFRSAFSNAATYAVNDVVTYSGSTYIAIAANQGPNNTTPDQNSAAWSLMAQQGAAGVQGQNGAAGPQGQTGQTGAIGPQGPQGPQGPSGVMDPRYTITLCQIDHDGSGINGVLQSADSLSGECINALGATVTVTSVQCLADVSGATTVQVSLNGGPSLLTSACSVSNTLTTCSLNGSPTVASGRWLNTTLSVDSIQKFAHCVVAGIY